MVIFYDSREKPQAIAKILSEFASQGVEYERRALPVGDYWTESNPNVVVDRKKNLSEVCTNLFSPNDRSRFWREIQRAKELGIHITFLVEHGGQIKSIRDVSKWKNPYGRVSGRELQDKMYRTHISYGVDFIFCDKRRTGKEIIRLLGGESE